MGAAALWSASLAWRICGLYAKSWDTRWAALLPMAAAVSVGVASWAARF